MNKFNEAVNVKTVGTYDRTKSYEMKFLPDLVKRLEKVKKFKNYEGKFYVEYLPVKVADAYVKGCKFTNDWNNRCVVKNVTCRNNRLLAEVSYETGNRSWGMWLNTICSNGKEFSYDKLAEKWFVKVTPNTIDGLINHLKEKIDRYNNNYITTQQEATATINEEVKSHTSKMVVTRQAVRKAMLSVNRDQKVVADAFNSNLTPEEQEKLINYLKKNVYSMRLYAVEGTEWDQALTELYPDEQYGLKRRTKASEASRNSIGGYISLMSKEGAPLDIIQKITHKVDKEASLVQNKGSNKFRLNNYMLVLFMLQNYNQDGFVTGKTNLYKSIV